MYLVVVQTNQKNCNFLFTVSLYLNRQCNDDISISKISYDEHNVAHGSIETQGQNKSSDYLKSIDSTDFIETVDKYTCHTPYVGSRITCKTIDDGIMSYCYTSSLGLKENP